LKPGTRRDTRNRPWTKPPNKWTPKPPERFWIDTSSTAVEAAMMFEAQALDLWLRCLFIIQNPECQGLLHERADQEKAHLKVLSRFLNRESLSDS